jgi:hypothetical protein
VTGLIFACNDYITSTQIFYKPNIISLSSVQQGYDMTDFSFQNNPNLVAQLTHTFLERCSDIESVAPVYYIMSAVWFVVSGLWIYLTYYRYKQYSLYVQKTLTLFPVCKVFESLITGFYIDDCPWTSQTNSSDKYIEMARISIVTISYTIFLAILFLMSKGWNTIVF